MSFHYWRNRGRPRKRRFVTLANSYHGETLGALAVGNVELYKEIYQPLLMDVITAPSPDALPARGRRIGRRLRAPRDSPRWKRSLAEHADEICAVIVEPLVQCAGGMRMHRPLYLQLLREACDRHGVHLIADEIAVGFGRTGTMFACEQAGITPDFLCLSKGLTGGYLPLSVVLTSEAVYDAFYDEYAKLRAFLHSHSYTGNSARLRGGARHARHLRERRRASSATARWPRTSARARRDCSATSARRRGAPARHDRRGRARARRRPAASPSTGASGAACASTGTRSSTGRCCGRSATSSISCRRT